MAAQEVPWERLDTLVPGEHDRYWDMALELLKIARAFWPSFLEEQGQVDAAVRRDQLIAAEAARLANTPEGGPVIAAGSTSTAPCPPPRGCWRRWRICRAAPWCCRGWISRSMSPPGRG